MPSTPHPRSSLATVSIALCLLALPTTANAASSAASETITAGSLTFINATPGAVAFPGTTLNGTDQVVTQTQPMDISDARGSGVGWNLTATSTAFNNGTVSLSNTSTTVPSAPSVACVPSVSCVIPTNAITYPYTLPAAAVAPAATKLYNAAAATGTGAVRLTPNWNLAIPATAATGTYNSTWTLSLVSGP